MVSHLFFDLDDTLWDFEGNATAALQILYKKYELERWFGGFEHFFAAYSAKNLELWSQYSRGEVTKEFLSIERFAFPLRQVAAPERFALPMSDDFMAFVMQNTQLLPDALEVVSKLAKNYSLTAISNGFIEVQQKKIAQCGLSPFFDHFVLSEAVGLLKPNREIYDYALKINGISPEKAVMIGDSWETDICGARRANIATVFFNPKHKSVPNTVPQITELKQLLEIFLPSEKLEEVNGS